MARTDSTFRRELQELLLMQLPDRDGQTQSELLDSVGLDHSTVSKALRRMQHAGLLLRVADEDDQRVWRVRLIRKGRTMGPRIASMWTKLEQVSVANLDPSTIETFITIAGTIQQSIVDRDRLSETDDQRR